MFGSNLKILKYDYVKGLIWAVCPYMGIRFSGYNSAIFSNFNDISHESEDYH